MVISAYNVQGKAQGVTWYVQSQPLTAIRRKFQTQYLVAPRASTVIFRRVKVFNNIKNKKTELVHEGVRSPRGRKKTQFPPPAATNKVPEENTGIFTGPLLLQIEHPEMLVYMFPYNVTRVDQLLKT